MDGTKRLYIAGGVTGVTDFTTTFHTAETTLVEAGYETSNPAQYGTGDPDKTWLDYMRQTIIDMMACDGVAALEGWWTSRGASIEVRLARDLGIPVDSVEGWVQHADGWHRAVAEDMDARWDD